LQSPTFQLHCCFRARLIRRGRGERQHRSKCCKTLGSAPVHAARAKQLRRSVSNPAIKYRIRSTLVRALTFLRGLGLVLDPASARSNLAASATITSSLD
jgi:hypothetical protein